MGATENAGFNAKVQRNLGLDFVTKQHRSLQKLQPVYRFLSVTCQLMLTSLYFRYLGDPSLFKSALSITHNLTHGMPYSSMLLQVNLDSLAARREDLSRRFFCDIMDPASCLHSLLPPPRSTAITCRLRSSHILPKVYTRTKRYCSFYTIWS